MLTDEGLKYFRKKAMEQEIREGLKTIRKHRDAGHTFECAALSLITHLSPAEVHELGETGCDG